MAKFIPREKLGKKAGKALDRQKRTVWDFSPVTRKIDSKKIYNRKKTARARKDDFGMSGFCLFRPDIMALLARRGDTLHGEACGVLPMC